MSAGSVVGKGRSEMHWYGWDGMGTFGWVGMLLMMLFWFGLIALLIWGVAGLLVRGQQSQTAQGPTEDHATSILRERYARGEITDEESIEVRKTLNAVDELIDRARP